jgi:hypothetical protein
VVTEADDGGGMYACVGPMSSSPHGASSSDPMSCTSLFKKTIVVMGIVDVSMPVATLAQ